MKSDSIFSKIFKFSNKSSLNPGDILYYKNNNIYWLYLDDSIDEESGIKKYIGINAMEYMKRIKFDNTCMYKVILAGDVAVFHYKFEHDRIQSDVDKDIKSGNAVKIKSLSEEELSEVKVFLYKYKKEMES